jgi:hypothetical protein
MPGDGEFYVIGGTIGPDAESYVSREADLLLLNALERGEFCYVLTCRQMGKSSLSVRVAESLRSAGRCVARLDLTGIGQNLDPRQWYGGLLIQLGAELGLERQVEVFWSAHEHLSPLMRWMHGIREVVLKLCNGPVVIFVDEIDFVRSLPFATDEFFAATRECYNRRTQDKELCRLTFCFLGVASPSDLIKGAGTTPFNIGTRVDLADFSADEARLLAKGLHREPSTAERLLSRVLYWTNGHPYLTQRLCRAVAEDDNISEIGGVDKLCERIFFTPGALDREVNLREVERQVLTGSEDVARVLNLYGRVRSRSQVKDGHFGNRARRLWSNSVRRLRHANVRYDARDPAAVLLVTSGIASVFDGCLWVRNRIYSRVFNRRWIAANFPGFERRRQMAAFRWGIATALLLSAIGWPLSQALFNRNWAQENESAAETILTDTHEVLRRYSEGPDDLLKTIPELAVLGGFFRKAAAKATKMTLTEMVSDYESHPRSKLAKLKSTTLYNRVLAAMHSDIGSSLLRTGEVREALASFKKSIDEQRTAIVLERKNRHPLDDVFQVNIDNILLYKCDLTSYYSGKTMTLVRLGPVPISEDSPQTQSAMDSVDDCLDEIRASPTERIHFARYLASRASDEILPAWTPDEKEQLYTYAAQALQKTRGHLDPLKREKWFDDALSYMTKSIETGSGYSAGTTARPARSERRYVAACTAALVGCGTSRTRWREKAVEWLESDLSYWKYVFERDRFGTSDEVEETLRRWSADRDLAGIRSETALAELRDENERKACMKLWDEVNSLHRDAERISKNNRNVQK